ncbi:MAG TPA: lysophospholipid acyltransferase family protein [Gemmatales bacterium]|nr:lysophospholipid acyltransferase family protein [Gemmatales bacterium]HMP61068.1 lysophospholipid acyltransferase family protein [Gemmatales bacterium]
MRTAWHGMLHPVAALAALSLSSLRVHGRRHVPRQGPLLVIANHQSFIDPFLVGVMMGRRLTYLARKTLYRSKLLAWILPRLGAIPLDQEGPATAGIKAALEALRAGEVVVLFPEGERTWDGKMQPLMPGVALLVRKARVPVLPIGLAGAYEALPRHRGVPWFCPLGFGATTAAIAGEIGPPIAPEFLLTMRPTEITDYLTDRLVDLVAAAERRRRRPD